MDIRLRAVEPGDLEALFAMQSDPESNAMAGTKARAREVFFGVWAQHFKNPAINGKVIEVGGAIVGSIACFQSEGRDCVGYWISREWWGRGVASAALGLFLREEVRRPLYATAARSNEASRRILERCGFRCVGFRMGEETERFTGREVAEFVLG